MHLLLANDDGIFAPGIQQLAAMAVAEGHKVTVCAPDRERSAASHAISVHDPLYAREISIPGARAFAVNGLPADCVRLGASTLVDTPVDVVLSGINRGANQGVNCLYSGTVGAAIEGALAGCQAVATSLCSFHSDDYSAASYLTLRVAEWLLAHPLPYGVIFNLNTPALPLNQIKGVRMASLAPRIYAAIGYERRVNPSNREYYWIKDEPNEDFGGEDCDLAVTRAGYASVTALTWDMTYRGEFIPPEIVIGHI